MTQPPLLLADDRNRATDIDLASERLGGAVIWANDEFFAAKENLVRVAEPVFLPDEYTDRGKWMDGWETRRRREPGSDSAIIRLGARGSIRRLVVNTAHFRGNYPEACAIDFCDAPESATAERLAAGIYPWHELVPKTALGGDADNDIEIPESAPATHVRLRIFPDGGVARLRVFGDVVADWEKLDATGAHVDLAAVENGGRAVLWSDMFFGSAQNMLYPGLARNMGDGWETRRRRGPGNDWALVRLGAVGTIHAAEIDTSHFKGNAPGACSIEVAPAPPGDPPLDADLAAKLSWQPLLPPTPLCPHTRHRFDELAQAGAGRYARLQIFPDGGIARLRLFGLSANAMTWQRGLADFNAMAKSAARTVLLACCGATAWADAVLAQRSYTSPAHLLAAARRTFDSLSDEDWREAFSAHPKIGERREGSGQAEEWSRGEQSSAAIAELSTKDRLARLNAEYEARFGHIFIVCATGRSAEEIVTIIRRRLENDAATELGVAAEQQRKITRLRLIKLLSGAS
ncbi:MAG TPA: allantoicase [Kofleriaceae bacterium]|nr:allantoicase [Kofleriaceae bacterium]